MSLPQVQYSPAVFVYSFRPINPRDWADGGFQLALTEDNTLVYIRYDSQNRQLDRFTFTLDASCREHYARMVRYAQPWLQHAPRCMEGDSAPYGEYSFSFGGQEQIVMYNLYELMGSPFRTVRGHYSRLVYNLMEDISGMLYNTYMFDFTPEHFDFTRASIAPDQPMGFLAQA